MKRSVQFLAQVVSTFDDKLQGELPMCLPLLVDRMGNEITHLTLIKASAAIASFPL
jgi:cullin-associated NEDD8-dissociated protein 1